MSSVSDILQQMAENAGRRELARGQTYGSLISNAANIPAQIMADREQRARLDLQRQRETAQMLYAQRADERATRDQSYQDQTRAAELVKQTKVRAILDAYTGGTPNDPSTNDLPAAIAKAREVGLSEFIPNLWELDEKERQRLNPKPYESDPTKDLRDPRTHALIRPGQPKAPEFGTDAYEVWARAQELQGNTPPAVGTPPPAPAASPIGPPIASIAPSTVPPGGPGAPATTAAPPLTPSAIPASGPPPAADARATDPSWRRADGTMKGDGFLGVLTRPDGSVSSEISIGVNLDGKEVEIPTLVPTLTSTEKNWLLTHDISDPTKIPKPIIDKAIANARPRIAAGRSPFAEPGESPAPAGGPGAPATPGAPSIVPPPTGAPPRPLSPTLQAYADARAAREAAKGDHSPIYKEWQDYQKQGGKLDFDAYMTMDANRKKPVIRIGDVPMPDLPAWATDDRRPTGPEANVLDKKIAMTPNGLHQAALTYIATGQSPQTSRGDGAVARAQRAALTSKVGAIAAASGMDEPALRAFYKSNAASLGQQQKMFDTAQSNITTADRNVVELEKVLAKLPDSGSPIFNQPLRFFAAKVQGDPNMGPLATYLASVQNEYGKIISSATGGSTVLTDSARHEAQTLLDPNATVAQMLGSIQALKTEGGNRLLSIGDQIKAIQERMQNPGGGPPKPGEPIKVGGFTVVVK